ncbi:MAG TPA: fasciclin domain-containing protein, partial [Polyangiales bacterium]|nr:fasciclin domain-containing protein [Polyangiales bacterium]
GSPAAGSPAAGAPAAGNGGGGGGGGGAAPSGPKNIVETAVAAGSFKQLAAALGKADLVGALSAPGPFTVFAPTDAAFDAFEKANPGVLAKLSVDDLTKILKYHVLSGAAVKSTDLKDGQLAKTLAGPAVAVDLSGDKPKIGGATVNMADIEASNGVIHVIDAILMPPKDIVETAIGAGKFTRLAKALTDAGLVETLKGAGPFTVFAPTDDAFAKLSAVPSGDALKNVLLYHVVMGQAGPLDLKDKGVLTTVSGSPALVETKDGVKIAGAKVTTANVVASNGVIHVIDSVMLPPEKDIVETAIAAGSFTKLAGALQSAGLVDALKAKGPFTVFAPTDAAFNALSAVPSGDALKNVLLYHVVMGAVGAGDLKAGSVPTLLADKQLKIDLADGVKVNDAKVSMANIITKNGVIHVIDKVLVPN